MYKYIKLFSVYALIIVTIASVITFALILQQVNDASEEETIVNAVDQFKPEDVPNSEISDLLEQNVAGINNEIKDISISDKTSVLGGSAAERKDITSKIDPANEDYKKNILEIESSLRSSTLVNVFIFVENINSVENITRNIPSSDLIYSTTNFDEGYFNAYINEESLNALVSDSRVTLVKLSGIFVAE